jgi:hypothetical protein
MTKTYIVEVSDTITTTRTGRLLVEADNMEQAEEIAAHRIRDARNLPPLEQSTLSASPWCVRSLDGDQAKRLAELLTIRRDRIGPLDADEHDELLSLKRAPGLKIEAEELFRFSERTKLGQT